MKNLEDLGWDPSWLENVDIPDNGTFSPARVASASNGRYFLYGMGEPDWAVTRGKLLDADDPLNNPAVGDWVLASVHDNTLVVEKLLPRRSRFLRKSAGKSSASQVIAANIDRVFIVTDVGADFSPRRIERYLTAIWDGGASPVIVVNKIDLPFDEMALRDELDMVAMGVPAYFVSAQNDQGLDELFALCSKGKTVAFVGSSGVGKSSLINRLVGTERQTTFEVREKDQKGRHTTTRQEMIVTLNGSILIDTAGMREFGLADSGEGLETTFADILAIGESCRFRDCTHTSEPGCAVLEAVNTGELAQERLASYQTLQKEIQFNEQRQDQRIASNSKKRWKEISKIIKNYNSKRQR